MSTPVDSVTTSTIRSPSFQPIYPVKKATQSKQLLTKRKDKTAVPERNDGKVVLDHIILRMISQALTNNGLFETVPSTSLERLDEKNHFSGDRLSCKYPSIIFAL
uniref:Uncharacterized protein n=1 Tax=Heterorhabditis bacteriophora TaxID=37862 RepID=A0A1I7WZU8_HETBA